MSYALTHIYTSPAKDQLSYFIYASSDSCEVQHDQTSSPELLQSYPTLCNPMDCSLWGSMKFSRQEHWRGLPYLLPGCLPNPGISNPHLLCLLHWQVGSLPLVPSRKPRLVWGFGKTDKSCYRSPSFIIYCFFYVFCCLR